MVHKKANWALKLAGLDAKLADAIIDGLRNYHRNVHRSCASGPAEGGGSARPARQRSADQARNPSEGGGDEGAATRQPLGCPVDRHIVAEGSGIDHSRGEKSGCGDGRTARRGAEIDGHVAGAGTRVRSAINQFVRRAAAGMAQSYGSSIVKLVSETIHSWDARTVTARLEAAVGRDLQYIRINGTLVGGLVGVVIYALEPL